MLDHVGDGIQQVTEEVPGRAEPDDLMQCELIEADVVAAHELGADFGGYYETS